MKKNRTKIIIIFSIFIIAILAFLFLTTNRNLLNNLHISLLASNEQNEITLKYFFKERKEESANILIVIQSNNGMKSIKTPDGTIINANGKNIVGIDYSVKYKEEYKFTITQNDNTETEKTVKIYDKMTVAEAKEIITSKDDYIIHMGTEVEYHPEQDPDGVYRIFYYDYDGKFGQEGTLYLKRDFDENLIVYDRDNWNEYSVSSIGYQRMRDLNPQWAEYEDNLGSEQPIDQTNEYITSYFCDSENEDWKKYRIDGVSEFAIATPPLEMFLDVLNTCYDLNTYSQYGKDSWDKLSWAGYKTFGDNKGIYDRDGWYLHLVRGELCTNIGSRTIVLLWWVNHFEYALASPSSRWAENYIKKVYGSDGGLVIGARTN